MYTNMWNEQVYGNETMTLEFGGPLGDGMCCALFSQKCFLTLMSSCQWF